jgi:nickel-dependent lactate racemase
VIGQGNPEVQLTEGEIRNLLSQAFTTWDLTGARLLVIIPDGTRSGPVDLFFRLFHELLRERVSALDYLVALGTHPPLSEADVHQLLGISADEMSARYAGVKIFNHHWKDQDTFRTLGVIPAEETRALTVGLLSEDIPVSINKLIFDYDQLIICAPVFPHEVAGFSGGNKYFFPGIGGPEMIDFTHWLSALLTTGKVIGIPNNPVRAVIDRAAALIYVPTLYCCQVTNTGGLAGLFIGDTETAWRQAVDLSSLVHIIYVDRPYHQVLSVLPEMYADLWTAAKGMYKLDPVIADGGEVILYAPHITEISYTHGHLLDKFGYHVRDYFTEQWDQFKDYPRAALAHATHLRGSGSYQNHIERPRIQVTLATGIPHWRCEQVNLGYRDPASIHPESWAGRQDESLLLVPHAGETLYRLKNQGD